MIDLEYICYISELLMDQKQTKELLSRRFAAIRRARGIALMYEEEGLLPELIEAVFCKKADFIMKAKTKGEMEKILKPSVPQYSCGKFSPGDKYHIEEEELILWSKTSLKGPLIPEGYKRFRELFQKYVGIEVENEAA